MLFTDLYMPNGDGFEVMTTLSRAVHPPKIIAISGQWGAGDMLAAAKLLGADLVLSKPVTRGGELLHALGAVFGGGRP